MTLTAKDVMQTPVRSVSPGMRVADLERTLLEERIGGVAVVEGERLVGIVSRSDLVRQLVVERTRAEQISAFYLQPFDVEDASDPSEPVEEAIAARWEQLHVEDVMIRELICVGPEQTLDQVARLMLERRVHRLLVTEGGRLLGVVSTLDLVRLFADGHAKAS